MDKHRQLINEIVGAIKEDVVRKKLRYDLMRIEFSYRFGSNKTNCHIDLLLQMGSTLHIFECKTGIKAKEAKKQLNFHKAYLLDNRLYLYQCGKLFSFSNVKVYYVSDKMNLIINLDTNESCVLNPIFLENPIAFIFK